MSNRSSRTRSAVTDGKTPFERLGVEPFINCSGVRTIYGGTLMPEAAVRAMVEAAGYFVGMDELMQAASRRLAELTGAPAGIVTCGAAAALCVAAAAAICGSDPEKMLRLPRPPSGTKSKIVMLKTGRFTYDHALRMSGATVVEVEGRDDLERELASDACLVALLAAAEATSPLPIEEIAEAARRSGVPVLVDAAGEILRRPNPWLARGATMVAYSGGKYLRGPQTAGLLLGEERWIKAAWMHSAPHHTFGRPLKVGKEEIVAMLAALEHWAAERDVTREREIWLRDLETIAAAVTQVPGVTTSLAPASGPNDLVPRMRVSWPGESIPIAAEELRAELLSRKPRIMLDDRGSTETSFLVHPFSIQPGEAAVVGRELAAALERARNRGPRSERAAGAAVALAGVWDVRIEFPVGTATHVFDFGRSGKGEAVHAALYSRSKLARRVAGDQVTLSSQHPYEGTSLTYTFKGALGRDGDEMSGIVELGSTGQSAIGPINMKEYGTADWTARRRLGGS